MRLGINAAALWLAAAWVRGFEIEGWQSLVAAAVIFAVVNAVIKPVAELTGLPGSRFDYVPVSDPDAPDRPAPYRPPQPGAALDVLFFGTGVPLHGLDVLLDAVGDVAVAVHENISEQRQPGTDYKNDRNVFRETLFSHG